MNTDPVDARELSCQGMWNVDDSYDPPRYFNGLTMQPVLNWPEEIERRHDVYSCDLIGCMGS